MQCRNFLWSPVCESAVPFYEASQMYCKEQERKVQHGCSVAQIRRNIQRKAFAFFCCSHREKHPLLVCSKMCVGGVTVSEIRELAQTERCDAPHTSALQQTNGWRSILVQSEIPSCHFTERLLAVGLQSRSSVHSQEQIKVLSTLKIWALQMHLVGKEAMLANPCSLFCNPRIQNYSHNDVCV